MRKCLIIRYDGDPDYCYECGNTTDSLGFGVETGWFEASEEEIKEINKSIKEFNRLIKNKKINPDEGMYMYALVQSYERKEIDNDIARFKGSVDKFILAEKRKKAANEKKALEGIKIRKEKSIEIKKQKLIALEKEIREAEKE